MDLRASLSRNFVFCDDIADILQLGICSNKNIILHGPAGHGKSEMSYAACKEAGFEPFVQFCGEGMTEAKLFGGLNFKKLETDKILEYYPERSFLNHELVIFEELFDAPSNVLLSLKDTLTAKELRNGAQRFPMKTKSIIGLTNRDPKDFAKMSQAAHALTERFPLKHLVVWKDYTEETYGLLFTRVFPREKQAIPIPESLWKTLINITAKEAEKGNVVSPRMVVEAFQALMNSAKINHRDEVSRIDFRALRFLDCFTHIGEDINTRLEQEVVLQTGNSVLAKAETEFVKINDEVHTSEVKESVIKMMQHIKQLTILEETLTNALMPDTLYDCRDTLVGKINKAKTNYYTFVLTKVRI